MAQRHALRMNRRRRARGHLFQGRFHSVRVQTDAQALEVIRYVHLNPVRAGLAQAPEDWPWSSHQAYVGLASVTFLTAGWILGMLTSGGDAIVRFVDFVRAGLDEPEGDAIALLARPGQARAPIAPDPDFAREAVRASDRTPVRAIPPEAIVEAVAERLGSSRERMSAPDRGHAAARARAFAGWVALRASPGGLTKLAHLFGRSESALSRGVAHLAEESLRDPVTRGQLDGVLRDLSRPFPEAPSTAVPGVQEAPAPGGMLRPLGSRLLNPQEPRAQDRGGQGVEFVLPTTEPAGEV